MVRKQSVAISLAALDPRAPELLIYEQRGGRLRLVGVEFLVIAEAWHAVNSAPPVLLGQHFQLVGAPNRYGLPPFYELHVWGGAAGTYRALSYRPGQQADDEEGFTVVRSNDCLLDAYRREPTW